MGVGAGEAGELVAGFDGDADFGCAAELDEAFEAVVAALAGYADVIELAGAGADGLLDWVEAVENFHWLSLPAEGQGIGNREQGQGLLKKARGFWWWDVESAYSCRLSGSGAFWLVRPGVRLWRVAVREYL